MPKSLEISVGIQMGRFVSVSSDRNIRDHLWRWSTYFGRNIPIKIIAVPFLTNRSLALQLLGNSVTKFRMTTAISIGSPDFIGKRRSIFLRHSH